MIAPSPADYDATLQRALARANRAGDALDADDAPDLGDLTTALAGPGGWFKTPDGYAAWAADHPAPLKLLDDEAEPDGPLEMPSHLLTTCPDYDGIETAITKVVQATEAKRAFGFQQAWWFARAYLAQRDRVGREAVLGKIASTVQKSKRQIYRYIVMGRTFAPETYNPELSQAVHLVAARANRPASALALAADEGWNASQLMHYLKAHTRPPVIEHPVNQRYATADKLEDAIDLLAAEWRKAAALGDVVEWHVRLDVKRKGEAA